jgi:hypothetical protein
MIRWAAPQYLVLLFAIPVVIALIAAGGWPIPIWCRA